MISAVNGLMTLASAVKGGSRVWSTRCGDSLTITAGRIWPTPIGKPETAGDENHAADPAGIHVLSQQGNEQNQQRAAEQTRRDEELQRVIEIRLQCVVVARVLRLEPLRQTHQQRERHLDEREKQQPDGGQED